MEVRFLQSGTACGNFALAVDRPKYGDKAKQTDFIDCTIWGERANKLVSYLVKGKPICVVGALNVRNYDDKDGNKRKAFGINVNELRFLPDGKSNNNQQQSNNTGFNETVIDFDPDDVPF